MIVLFLTWCVHAHVVASTVVLFALIDVCAALAVGGLLKPFVAHALVRAKHVLTHPIGTDAAGEAALVNVLPR